MVDVSDNRQVKVGLLSCHKHSSDKDKLQKYSLFTRVLCIGKGSLLIVSMSDI
jgi:hypothetical protein